MPGDLSNALAMLVLALLLDALLGEYPALLHPVVWLGAAIATCLRLAPTAGWLRQFCFGAVLTLFIVGVAFGLAWLALSLCTQPMVHVMAGAFLLKASFALRALGQAAAAVVKPLENGDLPQARLALRSLCSRPAEDLNQEEVLAATIESLAENASDSFVAPLFYFLLLGVPGAVAYRAINTLDSMIGYHGQFEALGKFAARLDDLVNLVPARLTALLLLGAGALLSGNVAQGWNILRRDGAKTPSPNGGRPMAAMAGLLDVRLVKNGVYSLGEAHDALTPAKVRKAWRIVAAAGIATAILSALALVLVDQGAIWIVDPDALHGKELSTLLPTWPTGHIPLAKWPSAPHEIRNSRRP
jgi:adenosylcobinamide-phosphate synthase